MLVILGADHAGWQLKNEIKQYLESKYEVLDVGATRLDMNDDFSSYVSLMRQAFDTNIDARIVAICGSGVGMNIGLNKHKGVRCVLAHTIDEVVLARQHNDVNALSLSGRANLEEAISMIDAFLSTSFLQGKYQKRMLDIEIK